MKIIFFNGGLANQIFQYIFYRYAQINAPDEAWFLDDSFFFVHKVHNGYELEKVFGLHPKLLSEYFEPDVWEYMISLKRKQNKSIPQIMLESGTNIKMVVEATNWNHWNPFNGELIGSSTGVYNKGIIKVSGTIYYHGYWLTSGWFRSVEEIIRTELNFPEINEQKNLEYMKEINDSISCSIHIRRGDYVTIGLTVPDDFYMKEIRVMLETAPDITLFVFSDDLEYCKEHSCEMGLDLPQKTIYVEGNHGETAFRDLQLMSHCKYMINGNSAFCYLAALLNQNLMGIINPTERKL